MGDELTLDMLNKAIKQLEGRTIDPLMLVVSPAIQREIHWWHNATIILDIGNWQKFVGPDGKTRICKKQSLRTMTLRGTFTFPRSPYWDDMDRFMVLNHTQRKHREAMQRAFPRREIVSK